MYTILTRLHAAVKRKGSENSLLINLSSAFKILAFGIIFILPAGSILANTGDINPAFGDGGLMITPGKSYRAIAKQPDGKFVIGGSFINNLGNAEFEVSRFNADGSIDLSFGNSGAVHTSITPDQNIVTSISISPNGKIIVAGYHTSTSSGGTLVIARYNSNGTLDNTFDGDGKLDAGNLLKPSTNYKVAVQSDEKIVVLFVTQVARLNADGSVDNSFAGGLIDLPSFYQLYGIAIQPDGKILTFGLHISFKSVIVRYNTDGTRDQSFGTNGEVMTTYDGGYFSSARSAIFLENGKFLIAGISLTGPSTNKNVFALARYNSNGSLDTDFSDDGVVTTDFGKSPGIGGDFSINLETGGKIVAAGGSNDFQIARFNSNGTLDNSFSDDGITSVNLSKGNSSAGAVITGGSLYIAGSSTAAGAILANFFLQDGPASGLSYKYYTGDFNTLPDFSSLTVAKTGVTSNVDISIRPAGTSDHFAFVWEGYINIQTPGTYNFETVSDDGSKFYFNSFYSPSATALVSNDGLHAAQSASASVNIPTAGLYPVAITYFEKDGGEAMQLFWTAPGMARQLVPNAVFTPKGSGSDIVAPTTPENVHLIYRGRTFARLDWENSTDDKGVKNYQVYANGGLVLTTSQSFATVENLTQNTNYTFYVRAADSAGNVSNNSNTLETTTRQTGLTYKFFDNITTGDQYLPISHSAAKGKTNNIDLATRPSGVNSNYAFVWEGYINIPTPGTYTFETLSDDGSKFYFNQFYSNEEDALLSNYDNNGVHAPISVSKTIEISSAGLYPLAVMYRQFSGDQTMQLYWQGPGISRQRVPDAAFTDDARPGMLTNGLSYKYYEGGWSMLPDFSTLTPTQSGQTATIDLSKRPAGRNDNFAFVWEGYINIPAAGDYTFETMSDDGSKLYFNSKYVPTAAATVNNDGLHAATSATAKVSIAKAGTYPIAITFFENTGDQKMEVYWSGPFIKRQLIPAEAFSPNAPLHTNRLNYTTHTTISTWSVLPDFGGATFVKSGAVNNINLSARPDGRDINYAIKWSGYIYIPTPGNYTFETISDDGSKFYFNSIYQASATATVNNDGVHGPQSATGSMYVDNAGVYPIVITYFQQYSGQTMEVYWSGPGIPRQRIPESAYPLITDAISVNIPFTFGNVGDPLSTVVTSTLTSEEAVNRRSVYPNPFNDNVTVDFYNSAATNDISIGIFDLNGRRVFMNHPGTLPEGNNIIKMNLGGIKINDGVYIIQIQKNGIPWKTMKVVKMKK